MQYSLKLVANLLNICIIQSGYQKQLSKKQQLASSSVLVIKICRQKKKINLSKCTNYKCMQNK